ncbi:MAG: ABC transporter permease [Candidatus Dormibacteria bacterium]
MTGMPVQPELATLPGGARGQYPRRGALVARAGWRLASSDRATFVAVIIGMIVLWQVFVVVLNVKSYVVPRPLEVYQAFVDDFRDLASNTWATAVEVAFGFALAAIGGVVLGALMFYFRPAHRLLSPPIVAFQNVPKVALAPLFVVWFGHSLLPRVLVAFVIAFFPVLVNTTIGLRATKKASLELVQSMGASRWQLFRKVQFPAALPSVFGGLRVATTLVVIGAVVGEYIAADQGLGYLQLQASSNLNTPLLFASVILMAVLGLVAYQLVALAEWFVVPWADPTRAG